MRCGVSTEPILTIVSCGSHEPRERNGVHGDLIPGNVLTVDGRLSALIDWGGAGHGDTSQDLTPAWAILDAAGRPAIPRPHPHRHDLVSVQS